MLPNGWHFVEQHWKRLGEPFAPRRGSPRNVANGTPAALPFDAISPVNGRHYSHKTVDAVFADDPKSIVVVTVKVYYHD